MEEIANENLSILIQKLFLDKELAEKFSKCKTLDEFYDFCIGIQKGYTKEELKDTLDMLGSVDWKNLKEESGDLGDDDLAAVAGGAKTGLPTKMTAGILSLLSLCSVSFSNGSSAHAADDKTQTQSQTQIQTQTQTSNTTNSILQKLKNPKVSRTLKLLAVAAGAALVIGTTIYFVRRALNPNIGIGNVKGLANVGNSCYINASLQQLYSISDFRLKIMNYKPSDGKKSEDDKKIDKKIEAIKTIFKSLDDGKPLEKGVLKKAVETLGHRYTQRDAHEFLSDPTTGIGDIYEKIGFINDMLPLHPAEYSSVQEYFNDPKNLEAHSITCAQFMIPMSIRPSDIGTKLFDPPKEEPPKEKGIKKDAVKKDDTEEKVQKEDVTEDEAPKKGFMVSKEVEVFGGKKRLTGAIVKTGSKDGGHYYSYKVMSNGKWYCFNDSSVYAVSEQTVIRDMQENGRILVYSS